MNKKVSLLSCLLCAFMASCGQKATSESSILSLSEESSTTVSSVSEVTSETESSIASSSIHEHVFGEWKTTVKATCDHDGSEERSCECGETEIRSVPKLSEDGKHTIANSRAILDKDDQYNYECSVCHENVVLEFVDFDPEKDLSDCKWGNWEVSNDGKTISGLNRELGDQHYVTNICPGEDMNLILEMDVKGASNQLDYAANIGLGIAAQNDPGATWMGFNLSFPNTNARVFGKGVDQDDTRCRFVDYGMAGLESYHIRIEALANHWISYYVNGKPIAIFECPEYRGGYVSLCTWWADVEFSNIRYYVGKDAPMTAGMYGGAYANKVSISADMSDYKWGNWTLEQNNTIIHAVNDPGNLFYVSNFHVDQSDEFIVELDMKTRDTCGVVIVPNQADPGAAWLCQNINWDSSRAFVEGGANTIVGLESTYKVYEHKRSYSIRHIKITVTNSATEGSKHLKFEACGILIHECDVTGYTGGYIGFMTWNGESYFINPTISYIN